MHLVTSNWLLILPHAVYWQIIDFMHAKYWVEPSLDLFTLWWSQILQLGAWPSYFTVLMNICTYTKKIANWTCLQGRYRKNYIEADEHSNPRSHAGHSQLTNDVTWTYTLHEVLPSDEKTSTLVNAASMGAISARFHIVVMWSADPLVPFSRHYNFRLLASS